MSRAIQFLDLEAQVDGEEETELDEVEPDEFIVQDDIYESSPPQLPSHEPRKMREEVESLEELAAVIQSRHRRKHTSHVPPTETQERSILLHSRPTLWKKGQEYSICVYALEQSLHLNEPPISSIFYRFERDGYVVVETPNLGLAAKLLAGHSAVSRSSSSRPGGVDMMALDRLEADSALQLPPGPLETPGMWARLVRPRLYPENKVSTEYTGDPCLIDEVHWPLAQVLVVPRLKTHQVELGGEGARDDLSVQMLHTKETLTSEFFEATASTKTYNGLYLLRTHVRHLRSMKDSLPRRSASLFLASKHNKVLLNFPRVDGWEFQLGEKVFSFLCDLEGAVTAVNVTGVEITACHSAGTATTSGDTHFGGWALLKRWSIGDYLRHREGREGWVVEVGGSNLKLVSTEKESGSGILRIDRISGHVNLFIASTPPHDWQPSSKASPKISADGLAAAQTFAIPWKWREVIVWRGKHSGHYRVFDVIFSTQTPSGMKVIVETTVVNAERRIVVDYDDVVDRRTLLLLHIIERPRVASFEPCAPYRHPAIDELKSVIIDFDPPAQPPTRPPTPPAATPEDTAGLPPAWDPNVEGSEDPVEAAAARRRQELATFHVSQHPFLDIPPGSEESPSHKFNAKLTGPSQLNAKDFRGAVKEIEVIKLDGHCRLAYRHYKRLMCVHRSVVVEPEIPTKHTQKPIYVLQGPAQGFVVARVGCFKDVLQVVAVSLKPVRVLSEEGFAVYPTDCCILSVKMYVSDELNLLLKDLRAQNSQHGNR
ncbi:hypothetical protein PQX77_012775 [Marasmius sp. AFHP31]|nr:hypothetical protein PQX77_012775 [Marasmius sp. AFHP31]